MKAFFYKLETPQDVVYKKIDDIYLNISNIFASKNFILIENENLKKENSNLKDEILRLKFTENRYNQILEIASSSYNYSFKQVVNKPPFSPFDVLIIKSKEQLPIKSFVFYNDNLLGQVEKTNGDLVEVSLFSSSKSENGFYIDRTSNPISVFGTGAGNFYSKLPKDFDIKVGDFLIYDLANRYKIAKVLSIDSGQNVSFKDVYFKIPVSLYDISFVNILK